MEENFRILKPYLRGFPLIVLAMVLAVLVAKKYLSYATPMYESTVKLKLADVNEGVPSSNLFKDLDVFASANKIAAEIEVIKSRMMLNSVLDRLDYDLEVYRVGKVRTVELYHESPFVIRGNFEGDQGYDKRFKMTVLSDSTFQIVAPDSVQAIPGRFGDVIALPYGQLMISLNKEVIESKRDFSLVDQYEFEFISRDKLIQKISAAMDVVSIDKDVAVIRISIKSPVPEKAAIIANAIAETYITDYIETKFRAAQTTVKFLDGRIKDISKKLNESETNIQQYRDNRNIINIHQETETDLRKISQLKIQHANLKLTLDAIVQLDQYIQQGKSDFLTLAPNFEAFTDLLSTEIIKKIKQLQGEKKDLLLTFTAEDERVKVVDLKIADLTSYLEESISNTRKNAQIKFDGLTREIAEAEKAFIGVPEKERMLTILNREFQIYQQSYNFLNEKKIEAEIAQAARIAFHRVISPASASEKPVSPNRPIIIIVAAIMAMFGSVVLIFIVHTAKAKVNDTYTIERNSALPIALLTPFLREQRTTDKHFLREAVHLELKGILKQGDVVVISSSADREGRGFHSTYLANALAVQGRKVLLADATSSSSHRLQVLAPSIEFLDLSDSRFARHTKATFEEFMLEYKKRFDVIVINNESLVDETRALLLMSIANTNLFVLDSRRTPEKQITVASVLQKEFELPNFWFVLNRAGYNPNVARQAFEWVVKTVRQFNDKRQRRA